jgi:uvrABC system protein C
MVKNEKHKTATLLYGEDYKEIDLDRKGQAFQLIQRVQEEVHRFAITFHRQVRSKNTFASKLEMIDGVGPQTRKKLLRHFKTITAMKQASLEELQTIGISERVARNILEELGK